MPNVISVRQTRSLPPASFRLSYYSDNLNYPSKIIIRVKSIITLE